MGVDLAVQPRAVTAKPSFTVGTLRKAIPPHCFDRSLSWSLLYLLADLSCIFSLGLRFATHRPSLSPSLGSLGTPLANLLVSAGILIDDRITFVCLLGLGAFVTLLPVLQGAVATGVWVIAHECGHQAFSKWQAVNDGVGLVLHSALLVPYYSW